MARESGHDARDDADMPAAGRLERSVAEALVSFGVRPQHNKMLGMIAEAKMVLYRGPLGSVYAFGDW